MNTFRNYIAALSVTALCLCSGGVVSAQHLKNDTTGRIVNSGVLRFVNDTAKFANAQPDITKIDNKGVIEFTGKRGKFTDPDFSDSFMGDVGSTALGVRPDFRVPGLVRYARSAADSQYAQSRYFTNIELDKAAPKLVPTDVFVGGTHNVTATSGARRYEGVFHYDGSANQKIFPENSGNFRTDRYYNLDLTVSTGAAQSVKTLDPLVTARLDGVLTTSVQAPLSLSGKMLLGSDGADSSVTDGTIDVVTDGGLEMGRRPIRFNNNVTVTQGSLYAPDTAGTMHVTTPATLLLANNNGTIDMRQNTLMIVTGDFRNAGSGVNTAFNKNSTVVFDGVANQLIERTLETNPYGNVRTLLTKQVRGHVYVGSGLTVEGGDILLKTDTLTMLDPVSQPQYVGGLEEVVGAMRRMNIGSASSNYGFNNARTAVTFTSDTATYPKVMTMTVTPSADPSNPPIRFSNLTDANRRLILGYDSTKAWQATFRVGYREDEVTRVDQTKLIYFENSVDTAKEIRTQIVNPAFLYTRQSASPTALGYVELPGIHSSLAAVPGSALFQSGHDLVLRMQGRPPLIIFAKAFLEGPYRGNELMGMELHKRNLIPLTPPAMYPYTLDTGRSNQTVVKLPDSVVDWVTLEFRRQLTGGTSYFRNCFIRDNGSLVDLDGKSPVILPMDVPGDYFVALRHRNHLAVITANPFSLGASSTATTLDFSNEANVLGGFSALKPVQLIGARYVYALVAGDIDGNGLVDNTDYTSVWNGRDYEDYLNNDTQMNGIVNTLDFNVSWNNRLRQTLVP